MPVYLSVSPTDLFTSSFLQAVHVILRLFLRPRPIFSFATIIYLLATAASAAIYRFMTAAATNRRDAKGRLKTPENLDGRGVMEYCWDT